jgi:hypothetical protein
MPVFSNREIRASLEDRLKPDATSKREVASRSAEGDTIFCPESPAGSVPDAVAASACRCSRLARSPDV